MANDKRKHQRFTVNQAMTLKFARERYIDCEGLDISESGMLIETTTPIEVYDRLFMMFTINDDRIINIEAIVVRVNKKGKKFQAGVEIAEIKPEDKRALKKYLASL